MIKFLKKQNKVSISLIAALSENRVIGNHGRIPWHIRVDLIRFRNKTIDHTVIMGRKTFDSLLDYYQKSGKALPERIHIIVTRDKDYKINREDCFVPHQFRRGGTVRDENYILKKPRSKDRGVFIVHSIKEAIQLGKEKEKKSHLAKTSRDREIFVSGGAQIYEQTIGLADKLYLTIVKGRFKGDAYFPQYDQFKIVADTGWQKEGKDQFKFVDLVRK